MKVLIVEDNPGDQRLLQEAFRRADPQIEVIIAGDTDTAVSVLSAQAKTKAAKGKDTRMLVLLDLNLPRKNGKEFLAELKADPAFKFVPVLILTSSEADSDVSECYAAGANSYLKKPLKFTEYVELAQSISCFWSRHTIYAKPEAPAR